MNRRQIFVLGFGFVAGAVFSAPACVVDNPDHCYNSGGDSACPADRPYCSDDTCVTPTDDGCHAEIPTGCWMCNGKDGDNSNCDSMAEGDGDGDGDMTGDGDGDMTGDGDGDGDGDTPPECTSSDDCEGETPLCDEGSCVGCEDAVGATCAGDYPETPVCDGGSGMCVQCTTEDTSACSAETPVCEGGVCVPCDEHDQCPGSACNMSTGACMPLDRVWWVDQTVAASGDGSSDMPFKTIAEALGQVQQGEQGTIIVATPTVHTEQVLLVSGKTVALLGDEDGANLQFGGAPVIAVNSNAFLFASRLQVSQGTAGLACSGGSVWFDQGRIVNNVGNVSATDGGIVVFAGEAHLRNVFVGGLGNPEPGVKIGQGSVELIYTTVATGQDTLAVVCTDQAASVTIRNSLVVSRSDMDAVSGCADLEVVTSALENAIPGNTELGDWTDNNWFMNFGAGDLSLNQFPPAIAEAAVWVVGDPTRDIHGQPRPTVDGTADYAGADIP